MKPKFVYHGSPRKDIELFEPQISSHGKPLVYASPSRTIALLFAHHVGRDYVCSVRNNPFGIPTLKERLKNGLTIRTGTNQGYVYTLPGDSFQPSTQWSGEVVSEEKVKPLEIEFVPNLIEAIEREEREGRLKLSRWSDEEDFVKQNEEELYEIVCKRKYAEMAEWGKWHPNLVEKFQMKIIKNPRRLENL